MTTRPLPNLEGDYRIFLGFMTVTIAGMYVWVVWNTPALRRPLPFVAFSGLLVLHVLLHWFTHRVYNRRLWLVGYVLLQGGLAFVITLLSNAIGMVFALSMALIGESIGMMGLSRRGLAACAYFLALSLVNFIIFTSPADIFWWLLATLPTVFFVALYVTLYNRQAQAHDRARELLAELETANRQLSEYAAQVEDLTIAAERQRMARELHDTLSQGLAGLILQLEAADAHLAQEHPEKARRIVQQAMEQARGTLGEARQAIDDLRHVARASSLEEFLRQEVNRFSTTAHVPCALEIALSTELPSLARDATSRIAAEALANILHHAHAGRAWVSLKTVENEIRLEIGDDGIGFDPSHIPAGHYGLMGMRERARLAGGELEVESRPGKGSLVRVRMPAKGE